MECYYGDADSVDVEMQVSADIISEITAGRMTFQKAFMSGDMKMKGDFKVLRALDQVLRFGAG